MLFCPRPVSLRGRCATVRGTPCGGAISFCLCRKKWQKKEHIQGGHAVVSPLAIPPSQADERCRRAQERIAAAWCSRYLTFPGRDCVRGVKFFGTAAATQVPRRIFPRKRAHPLRVSASFFPTGFQRAAALWRLFSIFLFAEKYGPRRETRYRPQRRGPRNCAARKYLTCPADRPRRAVPCPQGIREKHRRRWRCASSCPHSPAAPRQPRCRLRPRW